MVKLDVNLFLNVFINVYIKKPYLIDGCGLLEIPPIRD